MRKGTRLQRIMAMVLGAVLLTGCGNSGNTQASAGESAEKDGNKAVEQEVVQETAAGDNAGSGEQVTIQFWHQGTSQADTEFAQKCVDSFEAKYPGIKVEITGMSSTISDQETKLNAAVLSDTYPDVIQLVLAEVGSRGALGDFENLDRFIETWEEKDDLFDSAYEMGKYQGEQVALGDRKSVV